MNKVTKTTIFVSRELISYKKLLKTAPFCLSPAYFIRNMLKKLSQKLITSTQKSNITSRRSSFKNKVKNYESERFCNSLESIKQFLKYAENLYEQIF